MRHHQNCPALLQLGHNLCEFAGQRGEPVVVDVEFRQRGELTELDQPENRGEKARKGALG